MQDNPALDDIALFATLAEAGSFVGAAQRLRQPKSTVSRRLRVLGERLGQRLIERTTRRMRLTEAGRAFLDRVRPALQVLAEAAGEARERQREPAGLLRVAADLGLATPTFSAALALYLRRWPRVTLELAFSDRPPGPVAEGFDLSLRLGPLEDSALVQRKLGEAATCLVAAPRYLAGAPPLRQPEDLAAAQALLPPRETAWTLSGAGGRRTIAVRGPLRANNLTLLAQAARDGLGIARLPRFLCRADLLGGALVAVLPDWTPASDPIHALLPSRQPGAAARALLTLLEEEGRRLFPD